VTDSEGEPISTRASGRSGCRGDCRCLRAAPWPPSRLAPA